MIWVLNEIFKQSTLVSHTNLKLLQCVANTLILFYMDNLILYRYSCKDRKTSIYITWLKMSFMLYYVMIDCNKIYCIHISSPDLFIFLLCIGFIHHLCLEIIYIFFFFLFLLNQKVHISVFISLTSVLLYIKDSGQVRLMDGVKALGGSCKSWHLWREQREV